LNEIKSGRNVIITSIGLFSSSKTDGRL